MTNVRGRRVAELLSISLCLTLVLSIVEDGSAYALSTFAMQMGGPGSDDMFRGIEKIDDGYIVVGTTDSFGAGKNDAWVIKLDGKW